MSLSSPGVFNYDPNNGSPYMDRVVNRVSFEDPLYGAIMCVTTFQSYNGTYAYHLSSRPSVVQF